MKNLMSGWLGLGLGCTVIWLPSPSKAAPQAGQAPQRPVMVASARLPQTAQSSREMQKSVGAKAARVNTARPGRKQVLWTD